MPLRQTLLSFAGSAGLLPSRNSRTRPTPSRTATTSSTDELDTIVLVRPHDRTQLPTPSESAEDVSSQGTDIIGLGQVPKGRAKRVSRRLTEKQSQNCLLDITEDTSAQARAVSGETLVNNASMSQTSLMNQGIAALHLPWSMSQVFDTGSKAELLKTKASQPNISTDSFNTLTPEEAEAEQERLDKAATKKAKMDENKKHREAKWEAEDAKATRRSSRASMLTKAGDMVSDLTSSVLGKRKDRVTELRGFLRPVSALGPPKDDTPTRDAKRRRVSDSAVPTATATAPTTSARKPIRRPRDKKWLSSGLFAGQARTFNTTLSESRNKRKSSAASQPIRDNAVLPLPMFAGERLLKQGRDFKLPFDVFSPLPAGQPKPDEWRKSNKNTFVGDASQEWRISKFIEHSTCMCSPAVGCDSDCMNRYMYYECDERNCNLTSAQCGNRAFEGLKHRSKKGGKYNIGVEVIKTGNRGYGVRSNRTFEPNQIIVEYSGEIVTQEECERRMHEVYKENECYYLMLFDQNMIIDATTRGSIARFVNHSCAPNCRMEKWTVGGQPRMALFAGDRGIMTGEELTYDYNFDPYCAGNVQTCMCGEEGCRGILGPKTKEEKERERKEKNNGKINELDANGKTEVRESKLKGVKRKVVEVVEESLNYKKRRVNVKEVKVTNKASGSGRNPPRSAHKSVSPHKRVVSGSVRVAKPKKSIQRRTDPVSASTLARRPSKLKSLLTRTGSKKESAARNRVVSGGSDEVLLAKDRRGAEDGSRKGKGGGTAKRRSIGSREGVKRNVSLKNKLGGLRRR